MANGPPLVAAELIRFGDDQTYPSNFEQDNMYSEL